MPSETKGTAIQIYLEWLRDNLPPTQVQEILGRLATPTRAALEALLPSVRYPYALYGQLLEASRAVLGDSYERLAFAHGRYAADVLLAGVYRLTVKVGNVERTLQSLATGWKVFFDTGEIEITESAPGRCVFVIEDASYHPFHPPVSAGYVQRACELAGAAHVGVSLSGSPPRVEMAITWESSS